MNHRIAYDNLIRTRKHRVLSCAVYYEQHHIVMRSMGGTDDPENLIMLTAREHFLAHWLLWMIHRNREASYAFHCMCKMGKRSEYFRPSGRQYQYAKEAYTEGCSLPGRYSQPMSIEARQKISSFFAGKKKNIASEQKRVISLKKRKRNEFEKLFLNKNFSFFPEKWRRVIESYLSGKEIEEIAKYERIDARCISQILYDAKQRIAHVS